MSEVSQPPTGDPAQAAWRSVLDLVGWGGGRPPRFPTVAMALDLAPKQLGLLWRLEPGEEKPMRVLGESIYCDASYTTDLVDRLEARGLIERRSSAKDRRVKLIALTPEGERCRERAVEMLYAPPEELTALEPDEIETLARLLAKALASADVPAAA
jgi:MarR family transcriptional regulator, organic hydroperoxide resistance regulator